MQENNADSVFLTLTPEQLSLLFERAAKIGAEIGVDKYRAEENKRKKEHKDKRYHNTRLLLRNYKALSINAENSVFGRSQMQETASDILDSMMNLYSDKLVVESIKSSATRTAIIVGHIRTMLDMYAIICERSNNEIDKRRYDIIYSIYISDEALSRNELADKWLVSKDTIYNDEKVAIERLSALIFGVDGLR